MILWSFCSEINFYSFVAVSLQNYFFFNCLKTDSITMWALCYSLQNAKHKGADSLVCQDHFTFNMTISRVNLEQLIVENTHVVDETLIDY